MRMHGFAYITELTDLMDKHNLPYPEAIVLNNNMYEDIEELLKDAVMRGDVLRLRSNRMEIKGITIIKGGSNV